MHDELKQTLFARYRVPLLAIGMIAPVALHTSIMSFIVSGLTALLTLLLVLPAIALFGKLVPEQIKASLTLLLAGAASTTAAILISIVQPLTLLLTGSIFPFIIASAVIASTSEMYADKKGLFIALFDAAATGLAFSFIICISGGIKLWFESNPADKSPVPTVFLVFLGAALIAGGAFAWGVIAQRKKSHD